MSGGRILLLAGVLLLALVGWALFTDAPWEGVDVIVVEGQAAERGVEPQSPLLNLEGDLLLFAFTAAGAAGGFIIGYYWRAMFGPEARARAEQARQDRET